ncbi:hypothetical protein M1615_00950 [Patescibacteria group bacterium]|nr:hypothetical protein [Patescibacteria group bacterium]MCL5010425.1 hypothetical protein [Patescibacteria group bacterium]
MKETLISAGANVQDGSYRENPESGIDLTEGVPDEEMAEILSVIGTEAKSLTLILLADGEGHNGPSLYQELIKAQGKNRIWTMDKNAPFNYCRSFIRAGLVERLTPYKITELGRETGIPLAGLLADFSEKHSLPLVRIFGQKSTPFSERNDSNYKYRKNRSIGLILKILSALKDNPASSLPLRSADIMDKIGERDLGNRILRDCLIRLSRAGLFSFVSPPDNSSKDLSGNNHSAISLTEKQKAIITELLSIIKGVQRKDPEICQKGRSLAQNIIKNEEVVSNLLQRAKEASSHTAIISREETERRILHLIVGYPNGLTREEMQTLLLKEYDQNIPPGDIFAITSRLKETVLRVSKTGGEIRFSLFPKEEAKNNQGIVFEGQSKETQETLGIIQDLLGRGGGLVILTLDNQGRSLANVEGYWYRPAEGQIDSVQGLLGTKRADIKTMITGQGSARFFLHIAPEAGSLNSKGEISFRNTGRPNTENEFFFKELLRDAFNKMLERGEENSLRLKLSPNERAPKRKNTSDLETDDEFKP